MKKIILIDMDGTITPARKAIEPSMVTQLNEVLLAGFKIAVVSGSSYEYILEQLQDWDLVWHKDVYIMPCNGTQCYHMEEEIYSLDMRKAIGDDSFKGLLTVLFNEMSLLERAEFPFTGDHVSYRGSTLNFCPVGRNATDAERALFKIWDAENKYRKTLAEKLSNSPLSSIFKFKLGGHTSIDIYPIGWDKSYAFRHFEEFSEVYFIGDRTDPMGNDFEGFIAAGELGFSTTGPNETIHILTEILKRPASQSQILPKS